MHYLLTDTNVLNLHPQLIDEYQKKYNNAQLIVVPPGEESKSLERAANIWLMLSESGATRKSRLICIGGGMITDLGGFAAACFKRGIPHINVATTLLAAVDAAIGGKTGVDFHGLKNEIGAFKMPLETTAYIPAFKTLPPQELLSGWAEAVKTAYIDNAAMTAKMLAADPFECSEDEMEEFVTYCRNVKMRVVTEDPTEKGLRKILNFGHTAGHALETLMLRRGAPVPHGVAVAHGMLIALIISMDIMGLPQGEVTKYAHWLKELYPAIAVSCKDYDTICEIAAHDKKNSHKEHINFVLLDAIGSPQYDIPVTPTQLKAALDLYQSL